VAVAALATARAGLRRRPRVEPPAGLVPYLQFQRMRSAAVDPVLRVVDEDSGFRERVAAEAGDEGSIGRAAWLFLHRPDGWAAELAALRDELGSGGEGERERRAAQQLAKRLDKLERDLSAARRDLATRTQQAERARTEAADERRRRTDAEKQLRQARADLERMGATVEAARAAKDELDRAERDRQRSLQEARTAAEQLERDAARNRVRDADAARRAARELASLRDRLDGALAMLATGLDAAPPPRTGPKPGAARRRPLQLPGGVRDDSAAAVDHLLRVPSVLLLVDGYNISKSIWPDATAEDQRQRLVAALDELAARHGCLVDVVFDGADVDGPRSERRNRRGVRVRFSPPDVEADDVVLDLVDAADPATGVVVASSDRRVRDGARRRGANVVSSQQLRAALRRGPR
jgi:predicted RNA-binding protein with PIN domain